MKKLIVLSGGLDSTTLLGYVLDYATEVLAVTFDYGQRHGKNELEAAKKVAEYYKVPHIVKKLNPDLFGNESPLMDSSPNAIPHQTYGSFNYGPVPTVVPFRNANLIAAATSVAVVENCQAVFVGVHASDAVNWAYPDCTPEFIEAMAKAVDIGTYHQVVLRAPFQYWNKAEIVKTGLMLSVPYHLTVSCYEGGDKSCGKCPTCIERKEAFEINGSVDPVEYQ